MRLAIGGPTRDTVPASFAVDLAHLYSYTTKYSDWAVLPLRFISSTYIHVGREAVLEEAIRKCAATHLLWLDTDMAFPEDTAMRLAKHNQAVVACNYVMRNASDLFTAFSEDQRVPTYTHSTGLEAVDYCGMGAMLLRTDVVSDLPRPWFRHGLNRHGGDIGEDVMFCRALRAAGHTIYIDHDLSNEVQHIGQHAYSIPQAEAVAV